MARKEINTGIEGNDGTGDSIRDSFQKVNDNFQELYSVLGLGSALNFVGLGDTPGSINENDDRKLVVVDGVQGDLIFRRLESSLTIAISYEDDPLDRTKGGVIRFTSLASSLSNDNTPTLANTLNAANNKISNLGDPELPADAATKEYTDTKISLAGIDAIDPETGSTNQAFGQMTGALVLSRDPIDDDDLVWEGRTAATKRYVDSKSYSSDFSLYVATNGDDNRTNVPESQRGRSEAAAYRTVQKACEVAEELVNAGALEIGPYQKTLTYSNGTRDCTLFNIVESPLSGRGAKAVARLGLGTIVSIVSGGSGYSKGQVLTLTGGIGTESTVVVNTVGFGGVILEVLIRTEGEYSELPPLITNIQLVGGANTGATISATFKVVDIIVTDGGGEKFASVAAATRANPVAITTTTPHGFQSGDQVSFSSVGGMTQLNGNEYYIAVLNETQFTLYEDSALTDTVNGTAFGIYTSGGTIQEGANYGSASVIFTGGGGAGAEARTTEVGGLIREITVVSGGLGFTSFPSLSIFLPRMLIETENKGTDFPTDLREGQILKGLSSESIARIVAHDGSRTGGREIFDVELIAGVFENGEVIQYGEPSSTVQITIFVDSGIYYENYPLRLAPNVTLRGADFRRSIIRPKPGVSASPWVRRFFRRDPVIDGLRVTPVEFGYHYLTDPLDFSSQPKNNDEIDVCLCNDAVRLGELSFQGHGGFTMVLDPEGQILSKSPYFQTGTTISKSTNQKSFAGGMFIDGFCGNLNGIILEDINGDPNRVRVGGLPRDPQLPNSFIIDGEIFRISLFNKLETEYYSAKLLLERNRTFIQEEVVAYVNIEYPDLVYDEEQFYSEVGLIVDSVVEDVLFGGFANSAQRGRLYFINGQTVIGGRISQTVDAINRAKLIAIDVIRQDEIIPINPNSVPQVTDPTLTDGDNAEAAVEECFDIIANIVENGETIYAAKSIIQANKEYISGEVIGRINFLYPSLDYDETICRRDVGLILDAVSIDIFGDYNNSIRAGYSYYSKGQRYIPSSQLTETIVAINYTKTLVLDVLNGDSFALEYTTKTFNPSAAIDLITNIITIDNHGFQMGARVYYQNGGGTTIPTIDNTLVNNQIYFVYVIDGGSFRLYDDLDVLFSVERTGETNLEVNFSGFGAGTSHVIGYSPTYSGDLNTTNLTDSGVYDVIDNAFTYITALIDRGEDEPSTADSSLIPSIYPQYELLLDNPYEYAYPGKINIGTAGNKSMLGNDFTQVNDMGYGIFVTNNGLSEQVSVFTYYCYTAYYALNGAQIRSLNGSCAHGVFALKSEGADPTEIPDEISLKFPTVQIARVYENIGLSLLNEEGSIVLYLFDYQYVPLPGSIVDIDHTGDPGGRPSLGVVSYFVGSVSTRSPSDLSIPAGVARLNLVSEGTGGDDASLRIDVPAGRHVTVRANRELVIADKEQIVATRPSTALIWDENPTNTTRVISFSTWRGQDAVANDVLTGSRDGFDYITLSLLIDPEGLIQQPADCGELGDTQIAVQKLTFDQRQRLLYEITGAIIYDGSTTGTGGMIFGWGDSVYEITDFEAINPGAVGNEDSLLNEYTLITFVNRTYGSGGLTKSIIDSNDRPNIFLGVRAGSRGNVTVNISLMRATGHDFLDIGTGSYAATNYPSNIYGPPENSVSQVSQAVEIGKGRVFYVSTDQSGNFRVGEFFGIDQGTGVVEVGANISLTNVQALRLKTGALITEFSPDDTLGGIGNTVPADDKVPTQQAVRNYIDRRLGLTHAGAIRTSGLIGPGYLPLDPGEIAMKGPIDMDDFAIEGLPAAPTNDRDAVSKGWVRLANLQDAPEDWLDVTPAYNTSSGQLLTFTGTNTNFINATVSGDITLSRSGGTLTATLSNAIINNSKIANGAEIAQSKLAMLMAPGRAGAATTTVSVGGFVSGRRYKITAVNSTNFIAIGASANTIGVIFVATGAGSGGTGTAIDLTAQQAQSGLSSFDNTQFTVTEGFVTVQTASSVSTGIPLSKLSHINAGLLNASDTVGLVGSYGKVIGRRGSDAGALYPIDFRTVIEDGDGLSRAEVPAAGVVVRTSTGVGPGKFTTITYGDGNTNGDIVRRSATDGSFSAGTITATSLVSNRNVTLNGGTTATSGIRITTNATTQLVLTRVYDGAGTGDYYTQIRDGNGGIAMRINANGSTAANNYTENFASEHRFRSDNGASAGTINIGDGGKLTTGAVSNTGIIEGTWNLSGSSTLLATWGDLAEYYRSDYEYEAGTVLIFGGEHDVTISNTHCDARVAGVVSKNYAFLMNEKCEGIKVAMALQGRVPCKVKGKIRKGDLMITSNEPGVACSSGNKTDVGTIIGKALENYDSEDVGFIEVAVGRL
jgi:hypothetical protein